MKMVSNISTVAKINRTRQMKKCSQINNERGRGIKENVKIIMLLMIYGMATVSKSCGNGKDK
jgi:hypothetical protein